MFNFKQYDWKRYNISLVIIVITLCVASAFILKIAGGPDNGPDLFKKQLAGLALGLGVMAVVSILDYHFICKFVILYYLAGILMVAATKFSPIGTDLGTNSYRWLRLGINVQPSEICKIILILTLAVFYAKFKERIHQFRTFFLAAALMIIPTSFILVQSDLSSGMVMIFIFAMIVFTAGTSYKVVLCLLAVGIPLVSILFWYVQQPYQKLISHYQYLRIFGFMNPELPEAAEIVYQQEHSIQSIASGKIYGKMIDPAAIGRNHGMVGVRESDFIFSVIGEELGFIGSCVIIGLLLILIIKCLLTARKSMDYTGMLISVGISAMFMFQVFANIGVATMILPNTGLPLPFLSSGISSMLSSMISIGLILNIGLQAGRNPHTGFSLSDL